jgi:hypothetical protein
MHPSYMQRVMDGKKTAGDVANDFDKHIGRVPEGDCHSELEELAKRFRAAVRQRNDIVHAMPSSMGEQTNLVRLTQTRFVVWSTISLADVATAFEKLADDLALAHFRLVTPPTVA